MPRKWGLEIQGYDKTEGYDEEFANLGRVAAQDDGEFWEAGEEGQLIAQIVGAAQYGNERVAFYFIPDGMDSSEEVNPDEFDLI